MRTRERQKVALPTYEGVFRQTLELFQFFRRMGIVPAYFFLAVFCTILSVLFNFLGMGLLIPFLRGLIKADYADVGDKLGLTRFLSRMFPGVFGSSESYFFLLLGTITLSVLIKNMLEYASTLSMNNQIRKADWNVRQLLIGRCLGFGKQFFDGISVTDVGNIIVKGCEAITDQLRYLERFFGQVLLLTAYLAILFWISWPLTLAMLVILPVHYFTGKRLAKSMKSTAVSLEGVRVNLAAKVFNVISCIPLVKAYAAEEAEKKRLSSLSGREIELEYETEKKKLLVNPILDINRMALLVLVAVMLAWFVRQRGAENVSAYLVYFLVVTRAAPRFGALTQFRIAMTRSAGVLEHVRYVMNDEGKFYVSEGSREFLGLGDRIEFRGLDFSYRSGIPILQNLSFSVEKGKMTAIVGPTGAGKTTVIHILMRFYECPPGAVLLDGTGIREFKRKTLMDRIALVSQDPMIFNDTLRANVAYGLERFVSDEEILGSLEKAQLSDWVRKLPQGLDTTLGDRGVRLSGGERQRVAIARAFMKNAEILILDEATSALDTKTERRIQEVIERLGPDCTTIVIAHRLSTIAAADKIVVIENGHAVEEGDLNTLLDKKGIFYGYWKAQDHLKLHKADLVEEVAG